MKEGLTGPSLSDYGLADTEIAKLLKLVLETNVSIITMATPWFGNVRTDGI